MKPGPRLFRRPNDSRGTAFWYAIFYVWNAKEQRWLRVQKSTKATDRAKAEKIANTLWRTAQLAYGGGGTTALTLEHAKLLVAEIMQHSQLPVAPRSATWEAWKDRWKARIEPRVSRQTLLVYGTGWNHFDTWLAAHLSQGTKVSLAMLSEQHLQAFWEWLRSERALSYNAAVCCLRALIPAFDYAKDQGFIDTNPAKLVVKTGDQVVGKRDILTPADVQLLLAKSPPEPRLAFLLGLCTALRLMDCVRMRWESIRADGSGLVVQLVPQKTAKKGVMVTIPVVEPLLSALRAVPESQRKGPLLPEMSTWSGCKASNTLSALMRDIGVKGDRMAGQKKQKHTKTFHSLRHTLTSWMSMAGVEKELRMSITGHTNADTHDLYTHQDLGAKGAALASALKLLTASNTRAE